ncbi:Flagellar basal-body rod protein FlgG [bioreactor metagenome]|uniref:Flagellar basal-body rod protein FlgG n=1 Tax=bioreactor metagenome TaxID=1076179 RepID=A0A644XI48_9ZZZZ
MLRSVYSAASGLKSQQARLDNIGNNLSNINTTGFKATRVDFKDALYSAMDAPLGGAEEQNLLAGNGVLLGAVSTDFKSGSLQTTGAALDFAILGRGFFNVETPAGETLYTRSGSFGLSVEETGNYLVTPQGYYVLDNGGGRISLPRNAEGLRVSSEGVLSTGDGTGATLGISDFTNPGGLLYAGDTCFRSSEVSGQPFAADGAKVEQGSLEGSNVDLAQEMALLLRSQRAYSLASRALTTADQMEGLANNLR